MVFQATSLSRPLVSLCFYLQQPGMWKAIENTLSVVSPNMFSRQHPKCNKNCHLISVPKMLLRTRLLQIRHLRTRWDTSTKTNSSDWISLTEKPIPVTGTPCVSAPFLHAETHNARQVHHTRNRILLALWGNRSLQSTQLLLLPKNWTLDTTNHSHRQLVISVKNKPQASAMSCYIHIKMMQIHQTNKKKLSKSFCSSATRSFLVSSATYKGL